MVFSPDEKRRNLIPGLKVNLSVQAQGQYNLRTAVDQRGEQVLNKDAKTVGGIKEFSEDNNAVTK